MRNSMIVSAACVALVIGSASMAQSIVEPPQVKMAGYNRSSTEPTRVVIFYVSDPAHRSLTWRIIDQLDEPSGGER